MDLTSMPVIAWREEPLDSLDVIEIKMIAHILLNNNVRYSNIKLITGLSLTSIKGMDTNLNNPNYKGRVSRYSYRKENSHPHKRIQASYLIHVIRLVCRSLGIKDRFFDIKEPHFFAIFYFSFNISCDLNDFNLTFDESIDLIKDYFSDDSVFEFIFDEDINIFYMVATDRFRKLIFKKRWQRNPYYELKRLLRLSNKCLSQ
jgi:hypothetical protein